MGGTHPCLQAEKNNQSFILTSRHQKCSRHPATRITLYSRPPPLPLPSPSVSKRSTGSVWCCLLPSRTVFSPHFCSATEQTCGGMLIVVCAFPFIPVINAAVLFLYGIVFFVFAHSLGCHRTHFPAPHSFFTSVSLFPFIFSFCRLIVVFDQRPFHCGCCRRRRRFRCRCPCPCCCCRRCRRNCRRRFRRRSAAAALPPLQPPLPPLPPLLPPPLSTRWKPNGTNNKSARTHPAYRQIWDTLLQHNEGQGPSL